MSEAVLIPLHGRAGIVGWTKVDADDAPLVSGYRWNLVKGYAKRTNKRLPIYRYILGFWDMALDVDHINGDKLDNRRSNLRICSRAKNRQNVAKTKRPTSSRFLGVSRKNNLWYVQISVTWKKVNGGYFRDEEEAALRYDELARLYKGQHAKTNFPQEAVSST